MSASNLTREIAEQYFDEMVEADEARDYDLWIKRWKDDDYSKEDYLNDRDGIREDLGPYVSREYIGYICCTKKSGNSQYHRYAWIARHEKASAVTTVGIYEEESVIYLNEKWFSYGDDSMYMLLLNYSPRQ